MCLHHCSIILQTNIHFLAEELKPFNLPKGWKWCFKRRTKGRSKNKIDMYIITDDGKTIRSSKELKNYLVGNNIGWMPSENELKYLFMPSVIFKKQNSQESDITYNWEQTTMGIQKKSTTEPNNVANESVENRVSELIGFNISNTQSGSLLHELKKYEYGCPHSENGCETALGEPCNIEEISECVLPTAENSYEKIVLSISNNAHQSTSETKDYLNTCSGETTYKNYDGVDQNAHSCVTVQKWVPPRSPFNLLQETFYHDPWQLLIATIFLTKTPANRATEFFYRFIEKWPTPEILLKENEDVIADFLAPLGLHQLRAKNMHKFTYDFLHESWKDPAELRGIGKYGSDSYKIFCLGKWRETKPQDHMLLRYVNWLDDKYKHMDVEDND